MPAIAVGQLRWMMLIHRNRGQARSYRMSDPPETKKPGLEDRAFCVSGAENRNRTYDLRVTSALLYRLSYFGGVVRLTRNSSAAKMTS